MPKKALFSLRIATQLANNARTPGLLALNESEIGHVDMSIQSNRFHDIFRGQHGSREFHSRKKSGMMDLDGRHDEMEHETLVVRNGFQHIRRTGEHFIAYFFTPKR